MNIAALIPHADTMVLLGAVTRWDGAGIACTATSHLAPGNPLRRAGRLSAVCGAEYAMQAMALHGALRAAGTPQRPGFAARLRNLRLHVRFLDEPRWPLLAVAATLQHAEPGGAIYAFALAAPDGTPLLDGTASIVIPPERPA